MKRILCLWVSFFILLGTKMGYTETLELITYYPAPFGAYDRMRLVPRGALIVAPCQIGTLYINEDSTPPNRLYMCQDDGSGGSVWGPIEGVWTQGEDSGNPVVYPTDTDPNLYVGIGTNNPATELEVNGIITATGGDSDIWNIAYAERLDWDGGAANLDPVLGRSSLGLIAGGAGDIWVEKIGDTMTGPLILPANGLIAGGSQLVLSGGRVGIGTIDPITTLEVQGNAQIGGKFRTSGNITTSAKIGIGTGAPSQELDVNGSAIINGDASIGGDLNISGDLVASGNAHGGCSWIGLGGVAPKRFTCPNGQYLAGLSAIPNGQPAGHWHPEYYCCEL